MLEIKTLGSVQILKEGETLSLGRQNSGNIIKLLMLLLLHRETGIRRRDLIREMFCSQDAESDPGSNLRVTVYRLRHAFKKYNIPSDGSDCVLIKGGVYIWNPSIPVTVDADEFQSASEQAVRETDQEKGQALCIRALQLYNGEYLPCFSTEEWVNCRQIEFTRLYRQVFEKAFRYFFERQEYHMAYELAERAAALYPYEEYQAYMIDALMATNHNKEALKLYERTADFYFREMGMAPSDAMKDRFKRLGDRFRFAQTSVDGIKRCLKEKQDIAGPYYCTLPSFIDNYRFVSRVLERTGQSAYIVVAMLENENKKPQEFADTLGSCIESSIRRGDMYTRYNVTTFLMLLMLISEEGCELAEKRILHTFREACGYRRAPVIFRKFPVFGIESVRENSSIFGNEAMILCIDEYAHGDITGSVYHQYGREALLFKNFSNLLTVMNGFFDSVGCPQPDTSTRSIGKQKSRVYNVKAAPRALTLKDIQNHRGKVLTVIFQVEHRCRSSWQGTMKVVETGSTYSFISELQFLKYITRCLEWHTGVNV